MIKPHHWPRIEFLSSRGQESRRRLSQLSNNLSSWGLARGSSGQVKDAWSSSPCLCVWSIKRDTYLNQGLCLNLRFWGDLIRFMAETLSGDYTNLLMSRGTQCLLRGMARDGRSVWAELSFLGQTFQSLWPFHNFWELEQTTNLLCWIIDFQGTCDLCCYCVLLLRSQI